ncbi:MAG: hypothetical protein IJA36_11055 [Lachnospiraceae bacterium]|nr:hypothetical protein [Lachnospiraceae bacterium]
MRKKDSKRKDKILKKRLITTMDLLVLLLIISGCIMMLYGNGKIEAYENTRNLEELTIDQIQENMYVKGTVNSTLCCYASIDLYECYVIEMGATEKNSQYITILADTYHSVALAKLPTEDYVWEEIGMVNNAGTKDGIEFLGIIKKLPEDALSYDFLKEQFNVDSNKKVNELISSEYCIKFIKEDSIEYWFQCGSVLVLCGIILYLFFVLPKLWKKRFKREEEESKNPETRKRTKEKVTGSIVHFLQNVESEIVAIIIDEAGKVSKINSKFEIETILNCFIHATYDKVYEEMDEEGLYIIQIVLENGDIIECSIQSENILFWYGNWYLMDSASCSKIKKIFYKNSI